MNNIPKSTITFLRELKKNNNREWFTDNKPRYQQAHQDFIAFIGQLVGEISKFDGRFWNIIHCLVL